jgi:alanine dehydrogenase
LPGVNVAQGKITNQPVADAVGLEYQPPFKLL